MNCCRYCARFEANQTDRRRAGRCTLTDTRTAPGGTCAAYADPVSELMKDLLDLLDRLRAAGCEPHLIPGGTRPRLAVRLADDWLLNRWANLNRRALITVLSRASSTGATS